LWLPAEPAGVPVESAAPFSQILKVKIAIPGRKSRGARHRHDYDCGNPRNGRPPAMAPTTVFSHRVPYFFFSKPAASCIIKN
jgi:hypothetical protein